ncbi:sensor histidine kinase [Floridanema evergladense]|uniref:histidine kinase n=1 Tax=Floridaenema evergladense BLCC-F167 TaxID=3153639 RepID=A0ABV4WMZ9_9CYAN
MSNYKLPVNDTKFQKLHWRLLLSYLTVMVAILGTSTVAIYEFFAHSLYQQTDQRLIILAQAAAHNFTETKEQYQQEQKIYEADKYPHPQVFRRLDGDGDLDISWHNLREPDQGVEWFDAEAKLLGNAGTVLPNSSPHPGFETINNGQIRAVTIAAYSKDKGKQKLEGYVRTSETTQEVEVVLIKLRWGLGLGSIFALTMTGIGGLWLTRQSLKPIIQSFQQLKQFTADASHELRSPLTAIKTSVDVMRNHPERIHPADEKKLAAIASATQQMSSLVEDLLLLTRMDAQTATINQQLIPIPLDEILSDLVDFLELQAEEKEITLKSHLLTGVFVKGDATKLTRLFANLIENALQYTPKGGTVTIFMKRLDRSVIVSVEDTGIGIAAENLPFVFDRFWRADKARTRREGGLGMGLAIAQAIAKHHHGEITVTSQLGVGSCFRVRLPVISEPKT